MPQRRTVGGLWANERRRKSFRINRLQEHPKGQICPFRLETKPVKRTPPRKDESVLSVWRPIESSLAAVAHCCVQTARRDLNRMSGNKRRTRGNGSEHGVNRRYSDDRFRLCRRPSNDSVCISGIALLHCPCQQVIIAAGDSIACRRLQFGIVRKFLPFLLPCSTRLAGLEV